MKKRKLISAALTLVMIGSLAACGSQNQAPSSSGGGNNSSSGGGNTQTSGTVSADPYGKVAESITLHIGRSEDTSVTYLSGQDSLNNYIVNHIADQLGITYEYDFSVPGDSYETKVGMAIASGEFPEVMTVNESQLRQLAAAGAIEDMSSAYETYASENLKAAYGSTQGISFLSATIDGKLMGMPNISPGADGIPMLYVRGDWMEELGLEAPKTVDDIVAIVNAFKEKKGTTNGLVVSSKITSATGNNSYGIDALFAMYGAYPKHFITDASGAIVYGSNIPEAREALEGIKKLVDAGVIDPSFVVRDSSTCEELVTSGQAGVFFGAWWNMSWPLNNMVTEDPTVLWNCYLAPLTSDGTYNTAMTPPSKNYIVVKAGVSEAVKEAVVKTMNYQFDIDQDQGVSLKADPTDPYSWTMMPFSLLLSRYDDKEGKALGALAVANGQADVSTLSGEALQWYEAYTLAEKDRQAAIDANSLAGWAYVRGAGLLGENESIMNQVFDASYTQTETMDSKWATLEKLEDETFLKILSGEAGIETFDSYVEQWNSLGGSTILEELEALK